MKLSKCLLILLTAINCFSQRQNYDKKVDSLFYLGNNYLYTQGDSANFYFEKIYLLASKEQDWETAVDILQYKGFTAGYHYKLSRLKANIERIDSLVKKQPDFFNENPSYAYNILISKGNYFFKIKDFKNARYYFNKLLSEVKDKKKELSQEDRENIISSNDFLAAMFVEEGKYNLALDLYEHNLRFIEDGNGENLLADKTGTERLIGKLYVQQEKYALANTYFKKCLKFYLKSGDERYKNNIITTAIEMTKNYQQLGKRDSTQYYLNLTKKNLLTDDPFWPNYHRIEGDVLRNENFDKALISYQMSLKLFKEKPNRFEVSEIVITLQKIAQLHEEYGNYDESLNYYQQALQNLSPEFYSDKLYNNPSVEKISDKSLLLDILKNKSSLLCKQKKYKAVLSTTITAINLFDLLRPSFDSDLDKQKLLEKTYIIFENGLLAAFNLYDETGESNYLSTAFHFMEKSKSVLLLEAIYSSKAKQFSDVPNSLLEKEQQLRAEITNLAKVLRVEPSPKIEEQLFQSKNEFNKTLDEIENRYPDYFNLKYNSEVISIDQIQSYLKKDETLLIYFYGESNLYSMRISSEKIAFKQLNLVSDIRNRILKYNQSLRNPNSDLTELSSLSYQLYNSIFLPSEIKNPGEKLYIIPDGLLNYIPFETLVVQQNPKKYLVENYSVSYVNSATLLLQLQSNFKNKKILSIAPSFDNSKIKQLQPLPNNDKEARSILNYFKGDLLENEKATIHNFQIQHNDYGIFHFATHAILDDEFPEYSYLAFTPTTTNDGFLYISDLYNWKLNANLVSLSACETGIGEFRRGEGFISLSRAFFYSGAKSIVNTLWKINDNSSTEIMIDFYANLSNGLDKDKALGKSQLSFLKKHQDDKLSHPYYWSSFTISGNINPIVDDGNQWIYVLFGVVFISLIILVAHRHKRRV